MITKEPSRKHIIRTMSNDNKTKFMEDSNTYIINTNKVLKNIKSKVMVDFVWSNQAGIIIATNKVVAPLNLQKIKWYIKSTNHIKVDNIEILYLSQSKSYLKIISILYLLKNTNIPIIADVVETITNNNHIFNNIAIVSRPRVIKISSKVDMTII